ncbi:carbohydrate kinase family protein [Nonomuraea diastatica]|uniref:carbohydrate kinase family protein n=1 Tax=Nonomuraea diastatica TaxID=1848329 RepID=UPI001407950F|nr:carbohydrate kinase family protein [Nonomuraea diastatica]
MTGAPDVPVVVFGDVCLHVTVHPSGSDEFCAGDVKLDPGGSAAMVALQLAALERRVAMVGVSGQDRLAEHLRERLIASGVDCSRWTSVAGNTARVAILVESDGGHRVIVDHGDMKRPGEALSTLARELPLRDDVLCYVPGFPDYDPLRVALVEQGARVVCDFGFRPWLTDAATARDNIVSRVNGVAIAICSGASFSEGDNRALAQACIAGGAAGVVTSLGSRGCLVSDAEGTTHQAGFATRAVNTLGAGDSLVAGLLAALADGRSLQEACVFAQAVAAMKITTLSRPATVHGVRALLATAGDHDDDQR